MNKCDYCGEYKKVRKEFCSIMEANHFPIYLLFGIFPFNYVCQDCAKAKSIQNKKYIELAELEKRKEQLEWIKERNKILSLKHRGLV
jgi:glutaredoxin